MKGHMTTTTFPNPSPSGSAQKEKSRPNESGRRDERKRGTRPQKPETRSDGGGGLLFQRRRGGGEGLDALMCGATLPSFVISGRT